MAATGQFLMSVDTEARQAQVLGSPALVGLSPLSTDSGARKPIRVYC